MNPPVGENTMEKEEDNYTKDGTVVTVATLPTGRKQELGRRCPISRYSRSELD